MICADHYTTRYWAERAYEDGPDYALVPVYRSDRSRCRKHLRGATWLRVYRPTGAVYRLPAEWPVDVEASLREQLAAALGCE